MIAEQVGFPLLVRPSYVLGGRAMEIVYSSEDLAAYLQATRQGRPGAPAAPRPLPRERDRGRRRRALRRQRGLDRRHHAARRGGRHPLRRLGLRAAAASPRRGDARRRSASRRRIALELGVVGLINVQFAVAGGELYVIEANPRASRTVPFVSKAIGAAAGQARLPPHARRDARRARTCPSRRRRPRRVKEAVLPFNRFAGADSLLGPEMQRTGEVMGIAADFPTAFAKAQAAAGVVAAGRGHGLHHRHRHRQGRRRRARRPLHDLGFEMIATGGTAQAIARMGVPVTRINKVGEGSPHVVDPIRERRCDLVINTPTGSGARADGWEIRTRRGRATGSPASRRCPAPGRGPRDPRRARRRGRGPSRCRRSTAAGPRASMTAPFGRRLCEVAREPRSGGYRRLLAARRAGARAATRASSTCSPPTRRWGEARASARSCRARSRSPTRRGAGRRRLDFLARGRRPRHRAAVRARARASGVWVIGPLGNGFSAPRELPRRRRRDPRRRRHRHRAAGPAAPALRRAGRPARVLLGFRDEAHSGGLDDLFACCELRLATDDGHVGHRGYVTDLLATMLAGDDAPSAADLRLRTAGDAGGGARRSAPARGRLRARPGGADGLRLWRLLRLRRREPGAATCASASTGRCSRGDARMIDFCGIELRHPVINASGHASTRSPRGGSSGTRCSRTSRSRPSSPRRSRSSRAWATRRRGSGRRRPG